MSGPMCFSNPPKLSPTCGAGNVEEIAGLQSYVTGIQDSHRAILLIADAFVHNEMSEANFGWLIRSGLLKKYDGPNDDSSRTGVYLTAGFGKPSNSTGHPRYEAPNLRKLADKVADAGFFVVVPDFFFGDPADYGKPNFDPEAWKNAHPSDRGSEDAKKVIAALKSKGYTAIGAAGFCWGGMVVVKLANNVDCMQAAVVLHPGPMTEDEINEVSVPFAILGAEADRIFSAEKIKHLASILAQKSEVDSFVKIFPDTEHGWSTRYKDEDEVAVKKAEESHLDMLNWLTKYIK